jgi:hypothetical protein
MRKSPLPLVLAAAAALLVPLAGRGQAPAASPTPDESAAIRTPPAPAAPRINGPRVYGERPGHPFFYHLPVTGERPMSIAAEGLPGNLSLDAATGNITGSVATPGEYPVTFTAANGAGKDSAVIRIVIGQTICLTPPLGWNSWNCFGPNIDQARIRGAADAMVATGLMDHGWTFINMDDRWEGARDAAGNIRSSAKIPDVKALADYVHGKGLKLGLYSSPGPQTCAGAPGSWEHEDQDAATYAGWGIDYLKYDLCSYPKVTEAEREKFYASLLPAAEAARLEELPDGKRLDALLAAAAHLAAQKVTAQALELNKRPYEKMRASLDRVNRDIVFSFCQYGIGRVWEWGAETGGNLWRTTYDIAPTWKSVEDHGFRQNGIERWASPGHWNDPDMLEVGNGALTPDENYTHMTLWCMLSAPLLIGCDMPKMSPFIVSLFSNDEVLSVNQDALGRQGWRARQDGQTEVWMKPLEGGALAVAFFNRGETAADVAIRWSDLKLTGPQTVRDLWRQKDAGAQDTGYTVNVAPHGAELFKVQAQE